jgi:hypothetical protein
MAMSYDPLFFEMPLSPALRAELGIPAGAGVWLRRFLVDGRERPDQRAKDYQGVLVMSLDPDAEGRLPTTWTPGFEPYRFRLARVRFRDDRAYGELRFSEAEGLHGQIRWPTLVAGFIATRAETMRAEYGIRLLWGLVSPHGRVPDDVVNPMKAVRYHTEILGAIVARFALRTPEHEITETIIAGDLHIAVRTLRYRLNRLHLTWAAAKQEARQRYSTTHP